MSTSGDNIRNNLAKPPDVETDDTTKAMLEEENDLSAFRTLMRGEPCWYYNEWKHSTARRGSNSWTDIWNDSDDEKLDKLKSFALWAIADLGMRGNDLHHTATYMSDGAEYARTEFEPVWEGDSGEAARESLKKFSKACTEAATAWEEFGHVASSLCGDIRSTVQDLINYGSNGSTVDQYRQRYWNFNDSSQDDHLENLRWTLDEVNGSGDISPGDTPERIGEVIDIDRLGFGTSEEECAGWAKFMDDHNDAYDSAITTYRDQVDTTIRTLEGLLNTFGDSVGSPSYLADMNPLAAVRPAKEKDPGDDAGTGDDGRGNDGKDDGKDKGGTGSPGTGSPGTGSPGTGSPGTGSPGTGSPGTGSPGTETEAAEDGGKPEPGKNPVTGQPLEIDPATGQPYPIDPTTGEPIKDAGDDQDTTVVQHGDKDVTVTEPSTTGEMTVGVDDGKGGAKNYQLDFDPNKNPDDGRDAKDGSVGGGAGGYGPSGSGSDRIPAGGKGGGVEDQVHTPGEDGKIRIKDGDLEIVAEQPLGPDGATVVTIDDGKGEPTTQILGDKEDVEEYQRKLAQDETRLTGHREDLEGRERVSKADWDELKAQEESFRERGGRLDVDDDKVAEKGDDDAPRSGEERSTPKSVFDEAKDEKSDGVGKSVFDDDPKGGDSKGAGGAGVGGGGGASAMSGSGGGGGGGIGGSAQDLDPGARSGAAAPTGGGQGAGLGTAPGGAEPAAAASGGRGGAGMMGAPMGAMGGGAGGGGGDDQQRSTNAAYQTHGGLFEPELAEGPFGVARISGTLDDEEASSS